MEPLWTVYGASDETNRGVIDSIRLMAVIGTVMLAWLPSWVAWLSYPGWHERPRIFDVGRAKGVDEAGFRGGRIRCDRDETGQSDGL